MDTIALLLADSRFPGGGHVHSGGLEEAIARGLVCDQERLAAFLRGRLHTAGFLAAAFAATAAHAAARGAGEPVWRTLDAELQARTPSPAQRAASRAQGRGTARAGERMCGAHPAWRALLAVHPRPHHALALGALTGAGGGAPMDAAVAAGYLAVSGPASAAVRLLGLDPLGVNGVVSALAPEIDALARRAAEYVGNDPATLPAPSSVALDVFAEEHDRHHREEVRLFVS